MATEVYLKKVFSSPPDRLSVEKFVLWAHEHPTLFKVIRIAALIVGIGLLVTLPYSLAALGAAAATFAVFGTLIFLVSAVALFTLDSLAPAHHDMKNHLYPTGECKGGKLYYEGDLPILSVQADDSYQAGRAQGYLGGIGIHELTKRFDFALHTLLRKPRAEKIPDTIDLLKKQIPPQYLAEMEGIVGGYSQWCDENPRYRAKKLTLDDLILAQTMPDSVHFYTGGYKRKLIPLVGCTALADNDAQKGPILARNMDWLSLGKGGKYSLIIQRNYNAGKYTTVEVGTPVFIGPATGMNSKGLSLAMNVCPGVSKGINGMPACIFNRCCLETCQNLEEVGQFVELHSPLGPYHLTVADTESAVAFHFFQGEKKYIAEPLLPDNPIIVLNGRHEANPYAMGEVHHSMIREAILDRYFTDAKLQIPANQRDKEKLLEAALTLPVINNHETLHSIVMEPVSRTFKVSLDDAFAAHSPLQLIPPSLFV